MTRLTLAVLMCMLAVKTVPALPVSKPAEQPALSVLPLQKTVQEQQQDIGQQLEQQQQTTEQKELALEKTGETLQKKEIAPILEEQTPLKKLEDEGVKQQQQPVEPVLAEIQSKSGPGPAPLVPAAGAEPQIQSKSSPVPEPVDLPVSGQTWMEF